MLQDIEKFKLNPAMRFDYKYFVDPDPTKFVEVSRPAKQAEEKKSPMVPILIGVTVAVALVLSIVLFVVGGNLFGLFGNQGGSAECPDLIGKVYNDVISDPAYEGFTITVDDKQYSTEFEAGTIMQQTPAAGKTLKGKREIVVKVSLGSKSQTLNDYTNYDVNSVIDNLEKLNIKYKTIQTFSDEVANGFVIGTIPAAGSLLTPETEVEIYVSKGPITKFVKVSDYVGMSEEVAKKTIEADGLTLGQIAKQESSQYPAGYVIAQSLAANSTAENGTAVDLVISSGTAIKIHLPVPADAQKPFVAAIYYNGQVIQNSGTIDPTALSAGASGNKELLITLPRSDKFPGSVVDVVVKYNDAPYIEYRVNFDNGQYAKTTTHTLPDSVLFDAASGGQNSSAQ